MKTQSFPNWRNRITRRRLMGLTAAGAAAAGLYALGCGEEEEEEGPAPAPAGTTPAGTTPAGTPEDQPFAGKTFKIGDLDSFTGPLGVYGPPISNGLKLAVEEVNAAGGLLGARIEVVSEDTESNADVAVQKARKLMDQDKVDIMFGVEASYLRDAIMPEVEQRKKILLYPANYEGERYSDYLFVFGMSPTQEFHEDLGDILIERGGGKRWYLLAADYVATVNINKYLKQILIPKLGVELVGDEAIPLDQTDFSATIQRIKDAKPNALINNLIGTHTIAFQQQAANFGITPLRADEAPGTSDRLVMEGTAYQAVTIDAMGETVEGAYRSIQWNDDIDTPENKAFVQNYQSKYGDALIIYITESSYNAVKCLEAAVKKVRSLDTQDLIEGLRDIEITAPSGPFKLRALDHHAVLSMYLTQVQGGKFATIKSYGQVAPSYDQHERKFSYVPRPLARV